MEALPPTMLPESAELPPREDAASPDLTGEPVPPADPRQRLVLTLVGLILIWTYAYNVLIKNQHPLAAFFKIIDTISDDFVLGSLMTIGVGCCIVVVFSITKLYSQIMANVHSFRMLEEMLRTDLARGRLRSLAGKLLTFRDQPQPAGCCPTQIWAILLSLALIYFVSWIYLIVFSEALFFVSWSAGVNLPINERNLVLMPTLALSIPFSARVMAYLRYPYAADYADFMPGAVFILLVVAALGFLFESSDQQFYLKRVFLKAADGTFNHEFATAFLKNGLFLAFIPVFFEATCWIIELNRAPSPVESQPGE